MQIITLNEKKKILLEMLIEIDTFCRKNDIQYFITGGTLLGAVRHKGFIPWDDDIDICFLRNDYDKFVSIFNSSSGNIEILNYKNTKRYIWPCSKAIDRRTYLEENSYKNEKMGVYIDLFPMDNLGNTYLESKRMVKSVKKYKDLLTIKHLKIDKKRNVFKNILVFLAKTLYLIKDSFLIKMINKKSLNLKNQQTDFIGNLSGAWGYKEITMRSYFRSPTEIEFEGHWFFAPIDYDKYLRDVYGDYLKLPPEEKRISSHTSIEYWR